MHSVSNNMNLEKNYRDILKGTGFENENLSASELMEVEQAINNSKETAHVEEEKREIERQTEEIKAHQISGLIPKITNNVDKSVKEKPFTPKSWSKQQKPIIDVNELENVSSQISELNITFQDMPETSGNFLAIIHHDPAYNLPIPTNPECQKLSIYNRVKLLSKYFTKLGQLQTKVAKKSLIMASQPKPISASANCKKSLLKEDVENEITDEPEPSPDETNSNLYVNRFGRAVKRKIYTEEFSADDSDSTYFTSNKKNKPEDSDSKITLETPYNFQENHVSEVDTSTPKSSKTTKKETNKRVPSNVKKSFQSDILFDKLLEADEIRKQKEEEMRKFEETLVNPDEDDNSPDESMRSSAQTDDENVTKRRIVPPVPRKRTYKPRKKLSDDFDKIVPASTSRSPIKQYSNSNKNSSDETQAVEFSLEIESEKVDCPICGKKFDKLEIESHASNCGIDEVEETPTKTNQKSRYGEIRCEICEKEFMISSNYEVHVRQCMASRIDRS